MLIHLFTALSWLLWERSVANSFFTHKHYGFHYWIPYFDNITKQWRNTV